MSYRINDEFKEKGFSYQPTPKEGKVAKRLPAGTYHFSIPMFSPPLFTEMQMNFDELIRLKGGIYDELREYVDNFASDEGKEAHRVLGTLWKTGILLFGRPGTGKTSFMHQLIEWFIEKHDAIVIYGPETNHYSTIVETIRDGDPDRLIMIVADEFEKHSRGSNEMNILNFLDGHMSKPGVIYLAATNYMHMVSDRIKNRPSRFNFVKEIPLPSAEHRAQILEAKLPKEAQKKIDMVALAEKTAGLSIDHVKAVMTYMLVYRKTLDQAVEIAKGFSDVAKNYNYGNPSSKPSRAVINDMIEKLEVQLDDDDLPD